MLKQVIYDSRMDAMRNGDKKRNILLGTLLGELDRFGKNPDDETVLRVIKKMAEGCRICGDLEDSSILETFLPKNLSEDELTEVIKSICTTENISEKKQMGLVMKSLKDKYPNQYDGKLASQIVNKILS